MTFRPKQLCYGSTTMNTGNVWNAVNSSTPGAWRLTLPASAALIARDKFPPKSESGQLP